MPWLKPMVFENENWVATSRERPKSIPPMMVAPVREVPGMSEKHCATPTISASFHVIESTAVTRGAPWRLYQYSTAKMTSAPTMSAIATGFGWKRYSLICFWNASPTIAAGRNATNRFNAKRCCTLVRVR